MKKSNPYRTRLIVLLGFLAVVLIFFRRDAVSLSDHQGQQLPGSIHGRHRSA